jgi:hypothetical protein
MHSVEVRNNIALQCALSVGPIGSRNFPMDPPKGIDRIFEIAILAPPQFDPPPGERTAEGSLTSEDSVQNVAMLRVGVMSETAGFPVVPS